jgi:hypothetical protein
VAGDDVTITIRADNGDVIRAFRDTQGRLRTMSGQFVSEGNAMSGAMNRVSASLGGVTGSLIPLAAAAAPLAAALAPVAVKASAAGVAVAAFGAAVAGQALHLSEASKAQDKYNESVAQYGVGSKQAAMAAAAVTTTFASMPAATARAAVGLQTLKDDFSAWSDEMAGFTMVPIEKSFTVLDAMIPRLTDMTKGASSQLNRLVTVAGGAVASPGFDALADRMSSFANESLKDAVDGSIHFMRALSEGDAGGPVQAFMEYAHSNGPALRETLSNISDAVTTLVQAAAAAGPGMLTLVNAAAGLVASLPPEAVATVMKLAVALKLVSLASAGVMAASGGLAAFGAQLTAMRAASTAAGGGMAGLAAGFGALSRAAKVTLIASGIGILVVALSELSNMGKKAPPDVDKITTSLRTLATTGKVSGEAARSFGKDLSGFADSLQKVTDPKGFDQVQQSIVSFFGTDSTPVKDAKENIDAVDQALANLVKNGQADLAAEALATLSKRMKDQGFSADEVSGQMDDYKSALADAKFEQELAVQSMGIFGAAAQNTSAQLEAQQGAADGLRASIMALNDVNRSAHDAQTQFGEALDNLTASFEEHGATLSADTEAGRANRDAMSAAAAAQDELIASGLAAGESLGSMTKKSSELRESMMALAVDAFDGNKTKATEYVNTLLGMPGEIKTLVKLEREEAITGLESVRAAIAATPDAKEVRVDTLNGAAIKALEAVGLKTKQLPDGKTAVYSANGQALGAIGAVSSALNSLDGKTANTYVNTFYTKTVRTFRQGERDYTNSKANGGILEFYADGGTREQHVAEIAPAGTMRVWAEPETGGEAYIPLAESKRGRSMAVLEETANRFGYRLEKYAKGGLTDKQKEARKELASSFNISRFGQYAGYKRDSFEKGLGAPADLKSLVSSLNDLRGQIKTAFSGKKETTLLKNLDMWGKGLIKWQKQLDTVTKSLEKAKDKLNSLKDAAASLASGVKGGILSSANITKGASGDAPTTVASIMGGLTQSRDKASAFSKALKDLKAKGLSAALIQQIAEAGIEGGGLETAGALLGASSSEIKTMNDLQSQINSSATSAGKTTADAVYGKAIAEQTRIVKNLTASQEKLEKTMATLAKNIEKLLQQAMKGKAAGGIAGAASGGVRSNLTWVGEHGPELLDLAPGSRVWSNPDSKRMAGQAPWASMLNTPRGGAPAARRAAAHAGPGGDGQPIVIQLKLGTREFGELWVDVGRTEVRARGSIEATLKPPRGR